MMLARRHQIDGWLLLGVLLLAAIGLVALWSAEGSERGTVARQAVWLGIGLGALVVVASVSYRFWGEAAPALYGLGLLGLVAVLMLGHRVNGSKSWIGLGTLNLQPSELAKVCTALMLARVAAAHRREKATLGFLLLAGLVVGAPILLISLQPDMGTSLTFVAMLAATVTVAGIERRVWGALLVLSLFGAYLGWNHVLKDYQKDRIRTFLDPQVDAQATGYQTIQSRIAIGSGGLIGKGYAAGTQSQLNFIPEKHTDFVFPVLAEEWGFLGSSVVLLLYGFLLWRGLAIARQARDAFGAYLVVGIMTLIGTHVLINLGMVTGLLPTIGIPLPLMSYGGSSMVSTLAGIGLVLNVHMRRIASA